MNGLEPDHIIHRQVFELELDTTDEAKDLYDQIQEIYQDLVIPILEQILEEFDIPGHIIRLDRLEIDLGHIPPNELSWQLAVKIERELRLKLSELLDPTLQYRLTDEEKPVIISYEPARIEVLQHFLEKGRLPAMSNLEKSDLEGLFIELIQKSPVALQQVLPNIARRSPYVIQRMVKQFSPEIRKALYEIFKPNMGTEVSKIEKRWKTAAASLPELPTKKFENWITEAILEYVLLRSSRSFDRKVLEANIQEFLDDRLPVRPEALYSALPKETQRVLEASETRKEERQQTRTAEKQFKRIWLTLGQILPPSLLPPLNIPERERIIQLGLNLIREFQPQFVTLLSEPLLAEEPEFVRQMLKPMLDREPARLMEFMRSAQLTGRSDSLLPTLKVISRILSEDAPKFMEKLLFEENWPEGEKFLQTPAYQVWQTMFSLEPRRLRKQLIEAPQRKKALKKLYKSVPTRSRSAFIAWITPALNRPVKKWLEKVEAENIELQAVRTLPSESVATFYATVVDEGLRPDPPVSEAPKMIEELRQRIESEPVIQPAIKETVKKVQLTEEWSIESEKEKEIRLRLEKLEEKALEKEEEAKQRAEKLREELQKIIEKDEEELLAGESLVDPETGEPLSEEKIEEIREEKRKEAKQREEKLREELARAEEKAEEIKSEEERWQDRWKDIDRTTTTLDADAPLLTRDGLVDLLTYILEFGEMPWWSGKWESQSLSAVLDEVINIRVESTRKRVQEIFLQKRSPSARRLLAARLISKVSEPVLASILGRVIPNFSGFVVSLGQLLDTYFQKAPKKHDFKISGPSEVIFRWEPLLTYAFSRSENEFQVNSLLSHAIRWIAKTIDRPEKVVARELAGLAQEGVNEGNNRFRPMTMMLRSTLPEIPEEDTPLAFQPEAAAPEAEPEKEQPSETEAKTGPESGEEGLEKTEEKPPEETEQERSGEKSSVDTEETDKTEVEEKTFAEESEEGAEKEKPEAQEAEEEISEQKKQVEEAEEEQPDALEGDPEKEEQEKQEKQQEEEASIDKETGLPKTWQPPQVLNYFLQHGSLPPDIKVSRTQFNKIIEVAIEEGGSTSRKELGDLLFRPAAKKRVIHTFSEELFVKLVRKLAPSQAKELEVIVREWVPVFAESGTPFPVTNVQELLLEIARGNPSTALKFPEFLRNFMIKNAKAVRTSFKGSVRKVRNIVERKNIRFSYPFREAVQELFDLVDNMPQNMPDPALEDINRNRESALPEPDEDIYVSNAGVVLLYPYFGFFFAQLGLMEEDRKTWKSIEDQQRGVLLLEYVATKQSNNPEFSLTLNKVLCGLDLDVPVDMEIEVTEKEKELTEGMIGAVIKGWEAAKGFSNDAFRGTFLIRNGKLKYVEPFWRLEVEGKTFDLVMSSLPFSIAMIQLPWMEQILKVEWAH